jgi:hypothetical protein
MEKQYFEVKVQYVQWNETKEKDEKQSESYVFNSVNFGDAEKEAYKLIEEYKLRDAVIKAIKPIQLSDIIFENKNDDTDENELNWFKAKIAIKNEEDEKKQILNILIQAKYLQNTYNKINNLYSNFDYTIKNVIGTDIFNVVIVE